ncbi:MAG: DNA repair protein RecO, partial [Chloroflexi bacterium]|nr:DNA repair protein RecO [Chloroflexota bacterium]
MGTENRYYESEGIIIRKIRLGEAARILTILTPGAGKVSAVAKGVCRSKSKMSGHLELFTHSQIEFARGRNLDTVINCQTINSFYHIKGDLIGIAYATYFCELADGFSEYNMECRQMFNLLAEC